MWCLSPEDLTVVPVLCVDVLQPLLVGVSAREDGGGEWVRSLHSITYLHEEEQAMAQCEQVDVSSAEAFFHHTGELGFREGTCAEAGFGVRLSDPEQVADDVVISEYGKAVVEEVDTRLRGTQVPWSLER